VYSDAIANKSAAGNAIAADHLGTPGPGERQNVLVQVVGHQDKITDVNRSHDYKFFERFYKELVIGLTTPQPQAKATQRQQ